ncbi:MAG: D-alanyl-D-alanine carboxypeptidase [bacterium]|nr:D-alanyl-D-alanine carboxypeptidase [bacterium]
MKKLVVSLLVMLLFCPLMVKAEDQALILNAKSGVLMEASTGKIIFEKNKDEKVAVASMTKMVAQILILEAIEKGEIKWTDKVTASSNASSMGGSQIFLSTGEVLTVEEMMKGISMASANDATVAMAEFLKGTEIDFVKEMNKKVKALGLKNTQFKNCTGLDEEGHYSSAYDMAVIAKELLKHEEILKFSSKYEDYLRVNTPNKFWLVNTNKLVRFYEGADGLKTGHTDAAKYCLAATAKKNDMRLIAIVLGEEVSKVRNSETMSLLDYGFNTYQVQIIKKKNEIVKTENIEKASTKKIEYVPVTDIGILSKKGDTKKKYSYDIKITKNKLPLTKGEIVGKIKIKDGNTVVGEKDITVKQSTKKLSYLTLLRNTIYDIASGNTSIK